MKNILFPAVIAAILLAGCCTPSNIPASYKGKPFKDKYYKLGPQVIPGRVELAYYDLGGEGVAYHDATPENLGAALNHTDGHLRPGVLPYIAFFREKEGVDISYTKDWADFNHPNKVDPKVNQLYIGWEDDGEWTNYTVNVRKAGLYRIITLYGNHDNGAQLLVNGQAAADLRLPEDMGDWHHWNQATVGYVRFEHEGLNLLTFKYNSGANWAYLDFVFESE